tara:strand:- start:605 stop:784 length:180 start_codon:yes stop_codon:yes gene_type:complete
MNPDPQDVPTERSPSAVLSVGILAWIGLTATFFFLRFTFIFYDTYRDAISGFLKEFAPF